MFVAAAFVVGVANVFVGVAVVAVAVVVGVVVGVVGAFLSSSRNVIFGFHHDTRCRAATQHQFIIINAHEYIIKRLSRLVAANQASVAASQKQEKAGCEKGKKRKKNTKFEFPTATTSATTTEGAS